MHFCKKYSTFAPESSTPGFRGWEMSPSRKAKLFDPIPSRGFQDIFKRRLLRSVLTVRNLANFKNNQDLATIDALRDIEYPSCAYYGMSFAHMHMRVRAPQPQYSTRVFYIRRGLRVVSSIILGNARASNRGTATVGLHAFFMCLVSLIINLHSWEFLCKQAQI